MGTCTGPSEEADGGEAVLRCAGAAEEAIGADVNGLRSTFGPETGLGLTLDAGSAPSPTIS